MTIRTVLNWIARGELISFQLPGRGDHRIRVEDFVAFLKRNRMPLPETHGTATPRVLIVDDNPMDVRLVKRILEPDGYELDSAHGGFTAGAKLGSFRPDLVILDLQMPGITGHEVIEFMKRSEAYRSIRILVVSSMSEDELDRARKAGADDILRKPVNIDRLRERAAALVRGRGGR